MSVRPDTFPAYCYWLDEWVPNGTLAKSCAVLDPAQGHFRGTEDARHLESLLVAYLHDPPDKPLSFPTVFRVHYVYASTAVGRTVVSEGVGAGRRNVGVEMRKDHLPTDGEGGVRAVGVAEVRSSFDIR